MELTAEKHPRSPVDLEPRSALRDDLQVWFAFNANCRGMVGFNGRDAARG